jgi:hypothetical protein
MKATVWMAATCLLLRFGIASTQSASDDKVGSVSGVVLDGEGSRIPGAKVYDEPMGSVRIGEDHYLGKGRILRTSLLFLQFR